MSPFSKISLSWIHYGNFVSWNMINSKWHLQDEEEDDDEDGGSEGGWICRSKAPVPLSVLRPVISMKFTLDLISDKETWSIFQPLSVPYFTATSEGVIRMVPGWLESLWIDQPSFGFDEGLIEGSISPRNKCKGLFIQKGSLILW